MARVGETERLVDSLVNRGLVAPKFVGRQVGQATIEELKNLGTSLATSQAVRRNEDINRETSFRAQVSRDLANTQIGGGGRPKPAGFDPNKLQILGKNTFKNIAGPNATKYTVLNPLGGGNYNLSTESSLSDIVRNLSQGTDLNMLPEFNTSFLTKKGSATAKSTAELQSILANIIKDPAAYQRITGA